MIVAVSKDTWVVKISLQQNSELTDFVEPKFYSNTILEFLTGCASEHRLTVKWLTVKWLSTFYLRHTQPPYSLFVSGTTWVRWCQKRSEEIFFWTFWVQGKITEADTTTIRLGATPSILISDPRPSTSIFMPDALPATTLPLYPGLGQAPNMLACIPSGVVHTQLHG